MRLAVSNQTQDGLVCQFGKSTTSQHTLLVPPFSETIQFSPKCISISFSKLPRDVTVVIKLSKTSRRRWQRVALHGGFPWTIYRNRVCHVVHRTDPEVDALVKQISRKCHVLVVFPYRDMSCFLATIPNSAPLSSLMLPGTHETMAFYGWPISQCQSRPLDAQLHAGIRVIDIRLSIIDDRLIAYHGIFPEVTPFADVLFTLHKFLTSPATASETVVVSIKQEDSDTVLFPVLVHEEIVASPGGLDLWFLEDRIPRLGEVRGKAVMISRFGKDGWENGANGIHPPIWPDSAKEGFQWECGETLVRVQDWYDISTFFSIAEKASLSTEILVAPADRVIPTLSISFMSASSIPLALPPLIARGFGWPRWGLGFDGVNDRVGKWLLDQLSSGSASVAGCTLTEGDDRTEAGPRIRGWVMMDYYEEPIDTAVVPLLVECNFRGRSATEGDDRTALRTW